MLRPFLRHSSVSSASSHLLAEPASPPPVKAGTVPVARRAPWAARLALVTLLGIGLSACGVTNQRMAEVAAAITPYQVDVLQGNVVTREQLQVLKTGMQREQARDILGSPLLTSVFHADRWDYVFSLRRKGQELQQRRVTLFFKDGVIERIDADELPSENEFVASLNTRQVDPAKVPNLSATETELAAMTDAQKVKPTANPVSGGVAPGALPSASSYPPLEAGVRP